MNCIAPVRLQPFRRAFRTAALTVLLATVLLSISTDAANAHATYESSDPASNAIVATAPPQVTIRFHEPLEQSYSRAQLYDQFGQKIDGTSFAVGAQDQHVLVMTLPAGLPNGTYTVAWQNVSAADGHSLQGFFAFTIGTSADVGTAAAISVDKGGPPSWLRAASRWAALLGLAASVAVLPMWLLVLRPAMSNPVLGEQVGRRMRRIAGVALPAAILGSVVALLVQAWANAGDDDYANAIWTTLTDTRYGRFWLWRIALFASFGVALAACTWNTTRVRRIPTAVALGLAAALPLPFSMLAHASAQQKARSTAIGADYVHLVAASLWVGGLFALTAGLFPAWRLVAGANGREMLSRVIPRFSVIAFAAWTALGLTGAYSAYLQVGSWNGLIDTAYGRTLTAKLVVLSPALVLAATNLLVISPRIRQRSRDGENDATRWTNRLAFTVAAETALVVIALLIVGRLIGQQPGREEQAAESPPGQILDLSFATQGVTRPTKLTISPATPGPNMYHLEVGGDPLPDGTEVLIRVQLPSVAIGQKEIALSRVGTSNSFEATGSELAIAGDWSLQVLVRKIGSFDGQATVSVPIQSTVAPKQDEHWHLDWPGLVGLAFAVLGAAALVGSWLVAPSGLRRQGSIGGGIAVAVGAILIYGALISPAEARKNASAVAAVGTPVTQGDLTVTLDSAFAAIGDNAVTIDVRDATGAPVAGATVTLDGEHPEMAMSLVPVVATEQGDGRYVASSVPITMGGDWELTVRVDRADEAQESFTFRVDVAE